ncbi:hypothetical protein ACIG0D_31235 [Streptomyces sp. NPDC052773]|uniref:hypothetical protein n=1 Tax=Streptomyces sp. NPDC052773 TaxID=3365693 RepID=UPI0037D43F67
MTRRVAVPVTRREESGEIAGQAVAVDDQGVGSRGGQAGEGVADDRVRFDEGGGEVFGEV